MIHSKLVSDITVQEIRMDPDKRVLWVEQELLIKNLPQNKGLAEFKKKFGSKGDKLWSDSYINDNFPELRKYVNLKKSNVAKLHRSKRITIPIIVRRIFGSRLTKNEEKMIDDLIEKNESGILVDSIVEFLATKKDKKNGS